MTAAPNSLLTWKEDPADHTGEHHQEKGKHFQVRSHQGAAFGMRQVLGSQTPLNDHLEQSGGGWKLRTVCSLALCSSLVELRSGSAYLLYRKAFLAAVKQRA